MKLNTKDFIKKARGIHGNKYNYSHVKYEGQYQKIKLVCPIHGVYEQTPNSHCRGTGCQKCGNILNSKSKLSNTKEFIQRAIKIHGNTYDYSLVKYKRAKQKVNIICSEHGIFKQSPIVHLRKANCPKCVGGGSGHSGFNTKKSGVLYYLKIPGTKKYPTLYKIGITNNSVERRYTKKVRLKFIIIFEQFYEKGLEAFNTEQRLIKLNSDLKYTGPPVLYFGHTELFSYNIFD